MIVPGLVVSVPEVDNFGRRVVEVKIKIRVNVAHSIRDVPIVPGTIIVFRKDFPKQIVYSVLPDDSEIKLDNIRTTDLTKPSQMGVVIDHGMCIDKQINQLELRGGWAANAIYQRWYQVQFPEMPGWVREDWIMTFEEFDVQRNAEMVKPGTPDDYSDLREEMGFHKYHPW